MPEHSSRRVARIDKSDLANLPAPWTDAERGRHLVGLLEKQGIVLSQFYHVEYYPRHQCWLLSQQGETVAAVAAAAQENDDVRVFRQLTQECRRAAQAAWRILAMKSVHFAANGCDYRLPPEPEVLTPGGLAKWLGDSADADSSIRFTSEGGWQERSEQ
jgi:hypothetical protein